MKFLIDNALSRQAAAELGGAGHDAVHVRDRGLQAAEGDVIFVLAAAEDRILVSADTGFGTLLALRQAANPSLILSRRGVERRPERQAALLLASLPVIADVLVHGAAARAGLQRTKGTASLASSTGRGNGCPLLNSYRPKLSPLGYGYTHGPLGKHG